MTRTDTDLLILTVAYAQMQCIYCVILVIEMQYYYSR